MGALRYSLVGMVVFGFGIGLALAQEKPKAAAPAAATPQALGTFTAWTAAALGDGAQKICYMTAKPSSSESRPAHVRRGDISVAVTHRPGSKQRDEVSFDAGYPIKEGAVVGVEVDQKRFKMYSRPGANAETAWSEDAATDKAMVEAMRAGQIMIVRAVSTRGSETVDTISLSGFSRAYAEIGKACGIK